MNIWLSAVLVIGAYLLGSTPHLIALARLKGVELEGDLHASIWQKAGKSLAIIGIIGEFLKGIVPVILGNLFNFDLAITASAGLAAVCGQMWPVFGRFDGEKGNTIGLAMATALTTWAMAFAIIPLAIGAGIRTFSRIFCRSKTGQGKPVFGGPSSNSLPLGMFLTFLILPFVCWFLKQPPQLIAASAVLFVLIIVRRLTAGLSADLKTNCPKPEILLMRIFLDRPATDYLPDRSNQSQAVEKP